MVPIFIIFPFFIYPVQPNLNPPNILLYYIVAMDFFFVLPIYLPTATFRYKVAFSALETSECELPSAALFENVLKGRPNTRTIIETRLRIDF